LPAYTIARVTVDGVPLEGYRVYAYTATGTYAGQSQLTDRFGDAAFTLAAGSYKFRVFYDGTTWWSPVVTAPATTTIRIDQDPLADTEVKVTLDGAPLEGYRVYAYDNAGTYTGQSEVTDAQGRALFSLPTGTYKFKSYYSGSWHWSPLVTTPATTSIDIVSDTVSDTVVKVTVDGSPLRSYRVYAYNPQGAYVGKSEVTNTSGEAVFALSGGQYKFKAYYGGSWYWSPLVTCPARTAITIVTQTIPDSVSDTVVTVTAGGYALQGYRVYGYNPEGTYTGRSELTDASGRAVFSLVEGSYKFKVYYGGAWHWSSVVSAPASVYIRIY